MESARTMTVEEVEERLGRNLRAIRLDRDLTQAELADRANVSLGAVRSLERGQGSTVTTLAKVLRALGQQSWIDALAPPPRAFNPLDLLEERRRAASAPRARRVRGSRSAGA